MVVRGAFGVLASARPVLSFSSSLLLLNPFAPVMGLLILPNLVYFFRRPQTNPDSAQRLDWRNWKLSLAYPATESVPANIHQLCDFDGRISRHIYNRIGLYECQAENHPAAHGSKLWMRLPKRVSQFPCKSTYTISSYSFAEGLLKATGRRPTR
jgi:hypothetical protein